MPPRKLNLIDTEAISSITESKLDTPRAMMLSKRSAIPIDPKQYLAQSELGDMLTPHKLGFLSMGNHLTISHLEKMISHLMGIAENHPPPGSPPEALALHDLKIIKAAPAMAQLAMARAATVTQEVQLLEVSAKKHQKVTQNTLAPQVSVETAYIQVNHEGEKVAPIKSVDDD